MVSRLRQRRLLLLILFIGVFGLSIGCSALFPPAPPVQTVTLLTPTPPPSPPLIGEGSVTPLPVRTATPLLTPPLWATATPTPTLAVARCPLPDDICLTPGDVRLHPPAPDGPGVREVFSGDQLTFEIKTHNIGAIGSNPLPVAVYLGETLLARGQFGPADLSGQSEALFTWVWDTSGISGTQTLSVVLDLDHTLQQGDLDRSNDTVQIQVQVRPASERPITEQGAHWVQTETECCIFHYITGTAAERDLAQLTALAEASLAEVETRLQADLREKFVVTFVGRVLGHGGYATGELVLSYLDRDYAGGGREEVFLHEGTHVIDREFAPARLTLLAEGLAVYVAGGHFRAEPLPERAAALLALGRYLPLRQLADNFYQSQHEIGYLEGGAFVHYLISTYGLERFKAFYGSFKNDDRRPQSEQLDAALRQFFGAGLEEMEQRWLAGLRALGPQPEQETDLRDTIAFYDSVRRYQQLMDPTAYFLDAWLPDFSEARKRNIVADALRHPTTPEHIALETMLIAADAHFDAHEYDQGERLLESINAVLDTIQQVGDRPRFDDPLAAQYSAIVRQVLAAGYEPQRITLKGTSAEVQAIRTWPTLVQLSLELRAGQWVLSD